MDHVFVIMMENTFASTYGLETNYFGVTHVSLPSDGVQVHSLAPLLKH